MKRTVLLTSCLMLVLNIFYGQSAPGFNKRYMIDSSDAAIYRLIVENDTIVTMGSIPVDTALWGNGIVLMKFDTNGNMLKSKIIVDNLIGQLPIELRYGNFQPTPDGGYLMSITPFFFEYPVILKTDHEFNVEFFKYYDDTTGYNYQLTDFTPISDGYLLFGSLNWNPDKSTGYVRKIDLEGETIWVKYFANTAKDNVVYDIEPLNDSIFMVACGHGTGFGGVAYNSFRIIDVEGNVLQTWTSEPNPEIGFLRDIISVDEEGYLVYGLYPVAFLPPFTYVVKSTISRLDKDFNILWSKHYGSEVSLSSELMFFDFDRTVDGNYLATGKTNIEVPDAPDISTGWLMKFSPEGDSIWGRLDTALLSPALFGNQHALGGAGILSSGSIVAGGYVRKQNDYYAWLIKVTNDGCLDTLYCGLVSGAGEELPEEAHQVNVYPNPANDIVTVETVGKPTMPYSASVHDAWGRLAAINLEAEEGRVSLSVQNLPNGVYFLTLKFPDERVRYEKIIIQH